MMTQYTEEGLQEFGYFLKQEHGFYAEIKSCN